MKMKKIIASFCTLFSLVLVFTSCKNDLEVLAPGKEMVSVYGILDPTQPVQNIRINKVYLNDKDALISAQVEEDINYGAGELTVKLERYVSGNPNPQLTTKGNSTKKEIVLTETVVTTQSGTFNSSQRIWQTTDKLYHDGDYKLIILKTATGEEIASARNVIIDSVSSASSNVMPFVFFPTNIAAFPNHGQYITSGAGITPTSKYIDYSNNEATNDITIKTIANAKMYDLILRFHYEDSLIGSTTPVKHYVDFNFNTEKGNITKTGDALKFKIVGKEFFANLKQEIGKQGTVANLKNRKALYMEYIVSAGAESLYDFLQVNAASTTIAQDKTYYTNITGGVGIFSSRSTCALTKDMIDNFINRIACHPDTYPLLFCNTTTGKPVAVQCSL
jgi:hypothetical protein